MVRGRREPTANEGRLTARPGELGEELAPGMHRLGPVNERHALLYVPKGYCPDEPAPLVLSLHGAGGNAQSGLYPLHEHADEFGFIVLSPASRGRTWDVILSGLGPDVAFIDEMLGVTFDRCAVDPDRVAISGFSDGASYALSLGISNGDLFSCVMAFSPGFASPGRHHGEPRFFVSHGTRDDVLRIDYTSRRVVPALEDAGYDVLYREFNGGHTVPPDIAREAAAWFLAGGSTPGGTPVT